MYKDIHRMSLWNKSAERSLFVQEDVEKDVTIINKLNSFLNYAYGKKVALFFLLRQILIYLIQNRHVIWNYKICAFKIHVMIMH